MHATLRIHVVEVGARRIRHIIAQLGQRAGQCGALPEQDDIVADAGLRPRRRQGGKNEQRSDTEQRKEVTTAALQPVDQSKGGIAHEGLRKDIRFCVGGIQPRLSCNASPGDCLRYVFYFS